MTTIDNFWQVIDQQLAELRQAYTAADVLAILAAGKNPAPGTGAGSPGSTGAVSR